VFIFDVFAADDSIHLLGFFEKRKFVFRTDYLCPVGNVPCARAVTLMKEAGIPAAVVMELVGHDSEAMSRHYTHVGAETLRKAAESLPDVTAA
jgi:hypothetical protein